MSGCEASDFRQFLSLSGASVSPSRLGLLWGVHANHRLSTLVLGEASFPSLFLPPCSQRKPRLKFACSCLQDYGLKQLAPEKGSSCIFDASATWGRDQLRLLSQHWPYSLHSSPTQILLLNSRHLTWPQEVSSLQVPQRTCYPRGRLSPEVSVPALPLPRRYLASSFIIVYPSAGVCLLQPFLGSAPLFHIPPGKP